ncbi:heavy-metal-associated domain-containing protein [Fodinibius salsisoli]|uniref:Heavy-metal-associated domain-containing protein n=1 Tax=Fodinibius salsisoli TaxID=2820877 RepID=A0ABT3PK19_9BACT|nr:heavy-metal-associated domain-containing protein [Fodinibius salsisoli]MCW9706242.1 heavy-metal-associated domain-containing protein [Fodinibius salsisoli]
MMKSFISIITWGILAMGLATLSSAQDTPKQEKTEAAGQQLALEIEGMACSMCEQNCKKSLEKLDGVDVESISASEGIARLIHTGTKPVSDKKLKEAVENAGYKLKKVVRKDANHSDEDGP